MAAQSYFILSAEQRATAMGFNTPSAEIDPRAVDHTSPPEGFAGKYVVPKRVVDDPAYPDPMKEYLLTLPFAELESETLFSPVEE